MSYELFEQRIKKYDEWVRQNQNDKISKVKAIEELCHCVRYAFPTFGQTENFVEYIRLDDAVIALRKMEGEIKEKTDLNDLGDQCDADDWLDLMKAITKQMEWMAENDE